MTQVGSIDTCSLLVIPKVTLKRLLTRSLCLLAGLVFASPAFAQYRSNAFPDKWSAGFSNQSTLCTVFLRGYLSRGNPRPKV